MPVFGFYLSGMGIKWIIGRAILGHKTYRSKAIWVSDPLLDGTSHSILRLKGKDHECSTHLQVWQLHSKEGDRPCI